MKTPRAGITGKRKPVRGGIAPPAPPGYVKVKVINPSIDIVKADDGGGHTRLVFRAETELHLHESYFLEPYRNKKP